MKTANPLTVANIEKAIQAHQGSLAELELREQLRYCWVDQEGQRVSPVHNGVGPALTWLSDWAEKLEMARTKLRKAEQTLECEIADLNQRNPDNASDFWSMHLERTRKTVADAQAAVRKFGRVDEGFRPTKLQRLTTKIVVEDASPDEASLAATILAVQFGGES